MINIAVTVYMVYSYMNNSADTTLRQLLQMAVLIVNFWFGDVHMEPLFLSYLQTVRLTKASIFSTPVNI
jgi:hypothetical protein